MIWSKRYFCSEKPVYALSFANLTAWRGVVALNYSLAVFIVILVHLKISARAESYTRSACRQPSFK